MRAHAGARAVLDGEAIALRADGTPQPFQVTMRRFGRKLDVERLQRDVADHADFFDVIVPRRRAAGRRAVAAPRGRLIDGVAVANLVPRIVTASPREAAEFASRAIAAGHEGVMAKALDGAVRGRAPRCRRG